MLPIGLLGGLLGLLAGLGHEERRVLACTCLPELPPREALAEADAVLKGTVTRVEMPGLGPMTKLENRLAVHTVWKGDIAAETIVLTDWPGPRCGYRFEMGQRYVVYAYEVLDGLWTYSCSRTRIANPDEARALGPSQPPPGTPVPLPEPASFPCPACPLPPPLVESLAEAAFVGRAVPRVFERLGPEQDWAERVELELLEVIKGPVSRRLDVRMSRQLAHCERSVCCVGGIVERWPHLVFAGGDSPDDLELMGLCGPTTMDVAEAYPVLVRTAVTTTLLAVADTYTERWDAAAGSRKNFGTEPWLRAGHWLGSPDGHVDWTTYIRFSVAQLADPQLIERAELRLTVRDAWAEPLDHNLAVIASIHEVMDPWNELGATGMHQPAIGPAIADLRLTGRNRDVAVWDVTELVRRWAGSSVDRGLAIQARPTSEDYEVWFARFYSRESEHVPELRLYYRAPGAPTATPSRSATERPPTSTRTASPGTAHRFSVALPMLELGRP